MEQQPHNRNVGERFLVASRFRLRYRHPSPSLILTTGLNITKLLQQSYVHSKCEAKQLVNDLISAFVETARCLVFVCSKILLKIKCLVLK